MTRVIEVIVSPSGETRIETKGFAGTECQAASRSIEQALGLKSSEQLTAEYHTVERRVENHGHQAD
jgi:hypothetical protein